MHMTDSPHMHMTGKLSRASWLTQVYTLVVEGCTRRGHLLSLITAEALRDVGFTAAELLSSGLVPSIYMYMRTHVHRVLKDRRAPLLRSRPPSVCACACTYACTCACTYSSSPQVSSPHPELRVGALPSFCNCRCSVTYLPPPIHIPIHIPIHVA